MPLFRIIPSTRRLSFISFLLATGCVGCTDSPASNERSVPATVATPQITAQAPVGETPTPLWLVIGGGPYPRSNEISIEQDVQLAAEVFAASSADGRVLFAGGSGSDGVQVRNLSQPRDSLLEQLGKLFRPRRGRDAQYDRVQHEGASAATRDDVVASLEELSGDAEGPALVYIAGHGSGGRERPDSTVHTWGGGSVSAHDVARILDEYATDEIRIIATTCYAGGFADILFRGADARRGPASEIRCGFFASEWDEKASGCDPSPDRRDQNGYGVHFLNALRGLDNNEEPLDEALIDLNNDGRISLLEAHTRARVAARGMGTPTTTSERWLRHVAPDGLRSEPVDLHEERALIRALEQDQRVAGEEQLAQRIAALDREIEQHTQSLDEAYEREDYARTMAVGELLARWPVADDPWHPDYETMMATQADELREWFESSQRFSDFERARAYSSHQRARQASALVRIAPLRRLARAKETIALAERLHARGGSDWERYTQLLACERSAL